MSSLYHTPDQWYDDYDGDEDDGDGGQVCTACSNGWINGIELEDWQTYNCKHQTSLRTQSPKIPNCLFFCQVCKGRGSHFSGRLAPTQKFEPVEHQNFGNASGKLLSHYLT